MKILLALFVTASIAVASDSVKAERQPAVSRAAEKGSFLLVWSNGLLPANIEDLRLNELEDVAGITRYVWEMSVPAGQRMIVRFWGKASTNPQASLNDFTWAVNGPLAPCFTNRISLVRRMTNNNLTAQFFLQINTRCPDDLGTRGNNAALSSFEIGPGWEGDWGATTSAVTFPARAWAMHLGTKDQPNQAVYQLEVSLAPADPAFAPGEINSPKR